MQHQLCRCQELLQHQSQGFWLLQEFEGLSQEDDWTVSTCALLLSHWFSCPGPLNLNQLAVQVPGGYQDSLSSNTELGRAVQDACEELDNLSNLVCLASAAVISKHRSLPSVQLALTY